MTPDRRIARLTYKINKLRGCEQLQEGDLLLLEEALESINAAIAQRVHADLIGSPADLTAQLASSPVATANEQSWPSIRKIHKR